MAVASTIPTVMDYDRTTIPAVYDLGRSHGPEVLDLWMNAVARYVQDLPVKTALDLGCGTGRFADALATRFGATVIGLDPSQKMLAQARGKRSQGKVRYVCGSGEAMPLADDTINLIFMSMVFHHFSSPGSAARECRRVGRPKAIVFLRAGTTEHIPAYPYVEFIPATVPLLYSRLNSKEEIIRTFETAGFSTVASDVLVQQIAPTHAAYADKLAAGGDSILASLSPTEFEEGLAKLRHHAALVDPQPVTEPIDLFVCRQ